MQRVLGLLLLWPLVADSKAFPARSSATHSGTFIWRRRSTKSPFVCHPHPPLDTVSPQHVDFLALPRLCSSRQRMELTARVDGTRWRSGEGNSPDQ